VIDDPVIILAGGLGTRLKPAVPDRPKPLAPVGDRPFLEFVLDDLARQGAKRVVLACGHGAEAFKTWRRAARLPAGLAVELVREPRPLGTGGALVFARAEAGVVGPAWALNGDTWLPGGLAAAAAKARAGRSGLALVRVDDVARYGRASLAADGRVAGFEEKGAGGPGLINAGLYRLDAAVLARAPANAFSLERDLLPGLAALGALDGWEVDSPFVDIGVPQDYRRFCAAMAPAAAS
jgi:D-glycero-alpha-D-manno-heptose 1-phosphate guanylyltransferase